MEKILDPATNGCGVYTFEYKNQNRTTGYGLWCNRETYASIYEKGAYNGYNGIYRVGNSIYNLFENEFVTDVHGRFYMRLLDSYQGENFLPFRGHKYWYIDKSVFENSTFESLKQDGIIDSYKVTEWKLLKDRKLYYVYHLKLSGPYGDVHAYVVNGFKRLSYMRMR